MCGETKLLICQKFCWNQWKCTNLSQLSPLWFRSRMNLQNFHISESLFIDYEFHDSKDGKVVKNAFFTVWLTLISKNSIPTKNIKCKWINLASLTQSIHRGHNQQCGAFFYPSSAQKRRNQIFCSQQFSRTIIDKYIFFYCNLNATKSTKGTLHYLS